MTTPNKTLEPTAESAFSFAPERWVCGVAVRLWLSFIRSARMTMRAFIILIAVAASAISAVGQTEAVPTFIVTSNDVVQSSIRVFRIDGTNQIRVSVKFAFTDAGAKRLEEFYRSHAVGQEVRYRIGTFERSFNLDNRKHFGREGFGGLPETEARAVEDALRGRR